MPLEHKNVVDFIGVDEESREVALVVQATEPWEQYENPAELLRTKVRNYTFFVLDGQLWRRYPELQSHVVAVHLEALEFPVPAVQGVLLEVSSSLSTRDIPFRAYWGDPPQEIRLGPGAPDPSRGL